MDDVIYIDEICKVLGIEPPTFPMFKRRTPDFPKCLGRIKYSKTQYSGYRYPRAEFEAWVEKEREKEAGWIGSHEICEKRGIKMNKFIAFRNRRPDFPQPVTMKRCMGKKWRALQFIEADFNTWLETANWDWNTHLRDDDDETIRYTTPETRPRLDMPVTLELCFIAGAFAPRGHHDRHL